MSDTVGPDAAAHPGADEQLCDVCGERRAEFVAEDDGERFLVCDPCRLRFGCLECGVVPEPGVGCDCPGGRPTLPRFEPV
jgi:hypothetical protein